MEFTEYRQPWETGPHWELKREFLEFYKDNFTEERLLCLAQAYSNIELLQCSYPGQVMRQIHELSKPLKGCQRFRGNGNAQSNHQDVEKQQKKRKNNEPASFQKLKFIKFCSGSDGVVEQDANVLNRNPLPPTFSSTDFDLIAKAQNFDSVKKLSEEVKKLSEFSKENAYEVILSAALHTNAEDLIDLKFTNHTVRGICSSPDMYYCEFFIGTTKIAVGSGKNRYVAKSKASENALYTLTHLKESPQNSLECVQFELKKKSNEQSIASVENAQKSTQNMSDASAHNKHGKGSLIQLALEIKEREKRYSSNPFTLIHNCASNMKIYDEVVYKISKDSSCPRHETLYLCDLFIKNTLIGQGEGSKMKTAKHAAAQNGLKYLENLIESSKDALNVSENIEKMSRKSESNNQEIKDLSHLQGEIPNDKKESTPGLSKSYDEVTSTTSEIIKEPFSLNRELLNNSYKRQLILFERSEELSTPEILPNAVLSFSAQMCRKSFSYSFVINEDRTIRADVLIDQEVFGTAVCQTKQTAKLKAAKNALERLKKQVYAVKVKPGVEEGYHINRKDLLQLRGDTSQAVSDDNIGCRMLKMMGWSGGGIGKMQGISEPICAGNQNFRNGLGYADLSGKMNMISLKSEIESLLQEYSKSGEILPLIFSMDFTKFERKEIHRIAQKYNLHNNSYGKGDARRLIIKRKTGIGSLLDLIIKAGGRTKKYELVDLSK